MTEPMQHDFPLSSEQKTRPAGIVLIAICTALAGLFFLLAGVALLLKGELTSISTILCLAFGVLFMSTAYGLWALKIWSYNLTRVICAVAILLCLLVLFAKGLSLIGGLIMIVAIGVLIYLHRKESRVLFAIGYFENSNPDNKSTNQEQAILSHNQSNLPSVTLASHSKSAEQEVSMEGGSIMKSAEQDPNSLASVKLEDRMSLKAIIITFLMYIISALMVAVPMIIDVFSDDEPLPNLAQMEKRSGIITSVYKARIGRILNSFFTIQISDGKSIRYRSDYRLQDQFKRIKGKQVTVWSVPIELGLGWWSYENNIMQVQYQDHLILDYENEYRGRIERNLANASHFFTNAVLAFLLFIIFASIWAITITIRKVRTEEGREQW